jgi:undecaprenyl-diphosphatase
MKLIHAIILGIIEGVTEFLPISSTGHLILASTLLKLSDSNFLKSFEIAIQLGAILSVVVLYRKSLITDRNTLQRVFVAFLPTAVVGLLVYRAIKQFLLGNEMVVLAALFLGGIVLILFEVLHKDKPGAAVNSISYGQAFLIGLFQSVSVIPGVSRSAATIIGGLALGIERRTIVEFSFLLAVPTMAAATGLDIIKSASNFSTSEFGLLAVGFIISFLVALLSIRFLLSFIKNHSFIPFGIYRILLAVLLWTVLR